MNEKEQKKLMLQANTYKILAIAFLAGGVIAFVATYISNIEGHILDTLKDPSVVIKIMLPFIPALFFSYKLKKTMGKLKSK